MAKFEVYLRDNRNVTVHADSYEPGDLFGSNSKPYLVFKTGNDPVAYFYETSVLGVVQLPKPTPMKI